MTILCVVGARPNVIKLAPVISALRASLPHERSVLVDTGQHYDPDLSSTLREQLDMPEPDHQLGVGSASHAVQTARVMERIEPILEEERPDLVVVPGDVNSTLAVALVAAKLEIPIAHIEAGLRSYDRSMPEEINRVLIDQLSEICFTHSRDAADNLSREGVARSAIHFVGNTMIDSLLAMQEQFRALDTARKLGLEPGGYVLVTLHRPALVDGPLLRGVLSRLELLARQLPVVFPVHPRTRRFLPGLDRTRVCACLSPSGIWSSCPCRLMRPQSSRTPAGSRRSQPFSVSRASPCARTPNGPSR